jgi:integrase
MAKKKLGRRKGRKTKGYFYRSGRGWYTKDRGKFLPLRYEDGEHIKDGKADERLVQEAHARVILSKQKNSVQEPDVTVLEVCQAYLVNAKATGAAKTHSDRADTLFDFCFGLPAEYRSKDGSSPKGLSAEKNKEMAKRRIHKGYGKMLVPKLRPLDIDQWLNAHKTWTVGGRRARIQAVKRALNYGVESGLIPRNPIRGYRTPKSTHRVTYITPEQERAFHELASSAVWIAIQVCIRTGARPGIEFCKLTRRHVTDHGDRMEWKFAATESKTGKLRIIRITDPKTIAITRQQMTKYRTGPIFRGPRGQAWTQSNLSKRFRCLKYRLEKKGIEFDDDCCIYSCRHTYAKRTLEGYWTGKPCNIETLARLMGNSPQVCRDHYLQWSLVDNEFLWENA